MATQSEPRHFRHLVRVALISFALLSAWFGIFMPFVEPRVREAWPLALGFCAVLAILVTGLVRNGPRSQKLFFVAVLLAFFPALMGLGLLWTGSHLEVVMAWFGIALYLLYAAGALGLCLAARGWYLYFSRR